MNNNPLALLLVLLGLICLVTALATRKTWVMTTFGAFGAGLIGGTVLAAILWP